MSYELVLEGTTLCTLGCAVLALYRVTVHQHELLADAVRMLASRDYREFAEGSRIETPIVMRKPKSTTEAIIEDRIREAQADPHSVEGTDAEILDAMRDRVLGQGRP